MPVFTLSYTPGGDAGFITTTTVVTIDNGKLHAKMGPIVKKEFPLSQLVYFYIIKHKEYKEFLIRYTKANGKDANLRFMCNNNIDDIDNLGDTLRALYPAKDLRKMDAKPAMKLMKAMNMVNVAIISMFILVPGIMSIIFPPYTDKLLPWGIMMVITFSLLTLTWIITRKRI